ncbi:hypothetical protein Ancab_019382 [Ancistrocladus abbreviatus]
MLAQTVKGFKLPRGDLRSTLNQQPAIQSLISSLLIKVGQSGKYCRKIDTSLPNVKNPGDSSILPCLDVESGIKLQLIEFDDDAADINEHEIQDKVSQWQHVLVDYVVGSRVPQTDMVNCVQSQWREFASPKRLMSRSLWWRRYPVEEVIRLPRIKRLHGQQAVKV